MRATLRQAGGLAALLGISALGGCDACGAHTPYTPYKLDPRASTGVAATDAGVAPSTPIDASTGFVVVEAAPPADGASFPLDDGLVAAPSGRTFAAGLALDLDGDGKRDLLAWARAPDGLRGELCFASGAAPSALQTIAAMPADVGGRGCTTAARLARIGKGTAVLELSAACTERTPGRAIRWLAVIGLPEPGAQDGGRTPTLRLELRLRPSPEGETITLVPAAGDEDGDGRDDLTITATLSGAPKPFASPERPPSAPIRFFDRPAGLSRDPSEPQASLRSASEALVARARGKSAASVPADALAIRELRRALCAEDGRALLEASSGPIACGDARPIEESFYAEGIAALSRSNVTGALAAALRLERLRPAPLRLKELDKLLAKAITTATTRVVRKLSAVAELSGGPAGLSPLRFEASGALLVRTSAGIVRAAGASFTEVAAPDVAAWPATVAFPLAAASFRFTQASQRCEDATLAALLEPTADGHGEHRSIPLPLLGPVGESGAPEASCAPLASVRAAPIDVDDAQGLVIAIGAEVIAIDAAPSAKIVPPRERGTSAPGTARSPDGASLAIATPRGVLVLTASAKPRLFAGPEAQGASSCVAADGGARIACLVGGAVEILEAP